MLDENKKDINPRNIFKSANIKVYMGCKYCGELYNAQLDSIYSCCWCKCQTHKTEAKLYSFIKNLNFNRGYGFDWCKNKNNRKLPFDFINENHRIIIELDCDTHFKDVKGWYTLAEEERANDIYKMKSAIDNGYTIIRLLQEEVFYDHFDWKTELLKLLDDVDSLNDHNYLAINISKYDLHKKIC